MANYAGQTSARPVKLVLPDLVAESRDHRLVVRLARSLDRSQELICLVERLRQGLAWQTTRARSGLSVVQWRMDSNCS